MQFNTKYDVKQRVYTGARDRVVSGLVAAVHCQGDTHGERISYDVWIDKDEKVGYEYWMTLDEKYFFATEKEAKADMQENRAPSASSVSNGKGDGKV